MTRTAGEAAALPRMPYPGGAGVDPLYAAPAPGMLGDDGATVELARSVTLRAACPICGRRSRLWHAVLHLPDPWGSPGSYRGCTRAHATRLVPADWATVSEGYALAAAAVVQEVRLTGFHAQLAALHRRQAARAAWLHRQPATVRRLALQLWTSGGDLGVEETAALVSAVLAEPPTGTAARPDWS